MTTRDRTTAIALARAEMERQKAQEQALLGEIVEAVAKHYPAGPKRRHSDWGATIVINLAEAAGIRRELVAKALGMRERSMSFHRTKRLVDARKALSVLAVVQQVNNR